MMKNFFNHHRDVVVPVNVRKYLIIMWKVLTDKVADKLYLANVNKYVVLVTVPYAH